MKSGERRNNGRKMMPIGVYKRSRAHRKKISILRRGKTLEELGHKSNCRCFFCKAKRKELRKEDWPAYGKKRPDQSKRMKKDNPMKQPEVAARRGEIMRGKKCPDQSERMKNRTLEEKGHKIEICQCFCCRAKRRETGKENHPLWGRIGINSPGYGSVKSKEEKEKSSRTMSRLIAEGKFNPISHFGKHGYFYSKKNEKRLWYRSSYELQAYKILEQLSKVVEYESEPFYIPYKFQEVEKNYVPDILITYDDDSQELIEVMRENLLVDKQRVAKLKVAEEYCDKHGIKFSIWTEKFLFGK